MAKQLILINKHYAFSKLPSTINHRDLCYILSKDYKAYYRLNKIIPDNCKVLNLGGILHNQLNDIKKPYLELFASLNEKFNSKAWWSSQISSRSSTATKLQLNIVYLFCARKIIDDLPTNKRVIFIAESPALLESISTIGSQNNFEIIHYGRNSNKYLFWIKSLSKWLFRIILFVYRVYTNRVLANSSLKPLELGISRSKTVLIRSWLTEDTINKNGIYVDRNFGELPTWFKSRGFRVLILPMFFNLGKTKKSIFPLIAKQDCEFLIQEQYLKFEDCFKTIWLGFKEVMIPLKNIKLNGLDLTSIFHETQVQVGFAPERLLLNQCYFLLKRLKMSGIKIDKFYYPFENNAPEKLFIRGCKKYFPDSDVIAFQHTAWYENQLGMYLDKGEHECHPIADKIICSGPVYVDVLKDVGFPKNKLIAGPNLRYASMNKNDSSHNEQIKRPNVLLPLTFDNDLAYDLIHKIKEVSYGIPELFVYVRRHPLLNYAELEKFLKQINFTNFEYADRGSMQDWFLNTDIVISNGGSIVIVETAAKGVPLIRIKPDNYFFLDPIAWSEYPIKPVNTSRELLETIKSLLKMEKEHKNKFKVIGEEILFSYFTETNGSNVKVF